MPHVDLGHTILLVLLTGALLLRFDLQESKVLWHRFRLDRGTMRQSRSAIVVRGLDVAGRLQRRQSKRPLLQHRAHVRARVGGESTCGLQVSALRQLHRQQRTVPASDPFTPDLQRDGWLRLADLLRAEKLLPL